MEKDKSIKILKRYLSEYRESQILKIFNDV